MSAHTPGPWTLYMKNDVIQVDGPTKPGHDHSNARAVVHWMGFESGDRSKRQKRANARLIAAAPEMLDALEQARDTARHLAGHLRGRMGEAALAELDRLANEWDELITKARGEA